MLWGPLLLSLPEGQGGGRWRAGQGVLELQVPGHAQGNVGDAWQTGTHPGTAALSFQKPRASPWDPVLGAVSRGRAKGATVVWGQV